MYNSLMLKEEQILIYFLLLLGTNIIDSQRITANSQLALAPFGDIFGHHMGSSMGNLPPSLRPPPEGGYPPLAFIDWG
ncbi:hypothetical protein Leryth_018669 [Lithospermum erythrorhizon]|nr:hypothetical protein Leryth_018669 [Lithospermum erythrorhizon]